ncbi:MAG: M20/M25/M40 family metallo-hydrolase [Verrucomicrobiales bacterium]
MPNKPTTPRPWERPMPERQFAFMRDILAAPSPIGLEAAMSYGVLKPFFEKTGPKSWGIHQFKGNAGIVADTHPGNDDLLTVMIIGHADKIRMQVRSIGDDGKIWINSDSFLPTTLIGHEVHLFSQNPKKPGDYRIVEGGTIEALGAIHFSTPGMRTGQEGITPEMLYLELQMHGEAPLKQVEKLGIRAGDPIILDRPIRRGFSKDTFYGAYLDNGLGCFVCAEVARLIAKSPLKNVRVQFAIASHEEIGRLGSVVMAGELRPDVVIGVDVNHDLKAAPGVAAKRFTPISMSKGFTLTEGSIVSAQLNAIIETAAMSKGIPVQRSASGRDTGTDAMAAVLAGVDAAATSVGFPIRNMHTISETGHTGDVLACIYGLDAALRKMDREKVTPESFRSGHPRLDAVKPVPQPK